MRRLRTKAARAALTRAEHAAREARIPALTAEVESASHVLNTPAARRIANGEDRLLLLEDVEALLASRALVVDACRNVVRHAGTLVSLTTRPVLFALARALGEAWPRDVLRDVLLAGAFGARFVDDSHRARLRVEIGRLRRMLRSLVDITATKRGFALAPLRRREVVVLAWLVEEEHASVLAVLADVSRDQDRPHRLRSEPASATCSGHSTRLRQRARCSSFGRARASLDNSARARIHDDLVTPRSTAGRLGWKHESIKRRNRS
jgi:DNA-binding winged helix-turn-helix (wHTH) protein